MKVDNKHNITGKQLAFFLKDKLELHRLKFALTQRKLGDAYNYKYRTLIMSEAVCNTASLASLTIVAHELGHAMHTYYSNKNNPHACADYSIFVAEIASTVNEVLLIKHLLQNAKDNKLKKYL